LSNVEMGNRVSGSVEGRDGSERALVSMPPIRLVVGEDDADTALLLSVYCAMEGHELVGIAETVGGVVDLATRASPDVVIVDNSLRPTATVTGDLATRVETLRSAAPDALLVMFTGDVTLKHEAERAGIDLFVVKGTVDALFAGINEALRARGVPGTTDPDPDAR
jgi:DNA-binding NarL/FixJ family response regulator